MCFRVTSPLEEPEACTPRLPRRTKPMISMELVRRRTWIFFDIRRNLFLKRRKNTGQGELPTIIATFLDASGNSGEAVNLPSLLTE
jgi:hypothetical protein